MLKKVFAIFAVTAILASSTGFSALTASAEGSAATDYPIAVQSDADDVVLDGGFIPVYDDNASKFYQVGTYAAGAKLTHEFIGTRVDVVGLKCANGGKIKVKIDGEDRGTVDLKAQSDAYGQVLASYLNLGDAKHKIEIETTGSGWVAIDYLNVYVSRDIYNATRNLALLGEVISSVPDPIVGTGNLESAELNSIRNEEVLPAGSVGGYNSLHGASYSSYNGSNSPNNFYIGYQFEEEVYMSKLVYQQGVEYVADGGWFENVAVQVLQNGKWVTVAVTNEHGCGNQTVSDGRNYDTHIFLFDAVEANGIRLYGAAGGPRHFVTVNQIEVYGRQTTKSFYEGETYKTSVAYTDTHEHKFTLKDLKPATCTDGGYTLRQCACGTLQKTEGEALGHSFDAGVITTPPTAAAEGIKTFTCERCHSTKTETIPRLKVVNDNKQSGCSGSADSAIANIAALAVALIVTAGVRCHKRRNKN